MRRPENDGRWRQAMNPVVREVEVTNKQGMHARPVMRFVDTASKYRSRIIVANVSRRGERLDGKSAMQLMLLEATQGCILRIEAVGEDAQEAANALAELVEAGCPNPPASPPV